MEPGISEDSFERSDSPFKVKLTKLEQRNSSENGELAIELTPKVATTKRKKAKSFHSLQLTPSTPGIDRLSQNMDMWSREFQARIADSEETTREVFVDPRTHFVSSQLDDKFNEQKILNDPENPACEKLEKRLRDRFIDGAIRYKMAKTGENEENSGSATDRFFKQTSSDFADSKFFATTNKIFYTHREMKGELKQKYFSMINQRRSLARQKAADLEMKKRAESLQYYVSRQKRAAENRTSLPLGISIAHSRSRSEMLQEQAAEKRQQLLIERQRKFELMYASNVVAGKRAVDQRQASQSYATFMHQGKELERHIMRKHRYAQQEKVIRKQQEKKFEHKQLRSMHQVKALQMNKVNEVEKKILESAVRSHTVREAGKVLETNRLRYLEEKLKSKHQHRHKAFKKHASEKTFALWATKGGSGAPLLRMSSDLKRKLKGTRRGDHLFDDNKEETPAIATEESEDVFTKISNALSLHSSDRIGQLSSQSNLLQDNKNKYDLVIDTLREQDSFDTVQQRLDDIFAELDAKLSSNPERRRWMKCFGVSKQMPKQTQEKMRAQLPSEDEYDTMRLMLRDGPKRDNLDLKSAQFLHDLLQQGVDLGDAALLAERFRTRTTRSHTTFNPHKSVKSWDMTETPHAYTLLEKVSKKNQKRRIHPLTPGSLSNFDTYKESFASTTKSSKSRTQRGWKI